MVRLETIKDFFIKTVHAIKAKNKTDTTKTDNTNELEHTYRYASSITTKIKESSDGRHHFRQLSSLNKIIIHRIGETIGLDAASISRWFIHHPVEGGTGAEVPYHFVVLKTGSIEQALPISEIGYHARRYNGTSIAIVCVGDFRKYAPTEAQFNSVKNLCAALCQKLDLALPIFGHTELDGASSDKAKDCPGAKFNLPMLKLSVDELIKTSTAMAYIQESYTRNIVV